MLFFLWVSSGQCRLFLLPCAGARYLEGSGDSAVFDFFLVTSLREFNDPLQTAAVVQSIDIAPTCCSPVSAQAALWYPLVVFSLHLSYLDLAMSFAPTEVARDVSSFLVPHQGSEDLVQRGIPAPEARQRSFFRTSLMERLSTLIQVILTWAILVPACPCYYPTAAVREPTFWPCH